MKKLTMIALACALAGCSATKVEYEKNAEGVVSYRIYRNSHWLKADADALRGGMTPEGKFEVNAAGLSSSPSEEFNRVMQTYTAAFIQMAQIAAAAYNPASTGIAGKTGTPGTSGNAATNAAATAAATCADGSCTDTDGTTGGK